MLSYPKISSLVGQDSVDEKLKGQRDHHVTVARVVQHVTCAHVMSENMHFFANPSPLEREVKMADFEKWVNDNGGEDDIIQKLRSNGFTSELSSANLDFNVADFVMSFNYGLQGLMKLSKEVPDCPVVNVPHLSVSFKESSLVAGSNTTIKDKISKHFHFGGSARKEFSAPIIKVLF